MPKNTTKKKSTVKQSKKATTARPSKRPTQKKASSKRPVPATPEKAKRTKEAFKRLIIQKLVEEKNKILKEVSHKVKAESNLLKFEIGDIYDIASNERERELGLMLGDRDREKLAEIEDAFERIKDNTFGECEECGEPIAEGRLESLPATRVCVECQTKNEREMRIKGRLEEESGLGILEKSETEEEEF